MGKRKADDSNENLNQDICDLLNELAKYEKNISKNIHKYNAYRKASSVLARYPKRVHSANEAKKLSGIGNKISKKIDEFLRTGKLEKLEKIRQDGRSNAINLFTRISGIGPAKAQELVDSGILTLNDLKDNEEKLNNHQKIGLKYMRDFELKIPRQEITKIEKIMQYELKKFDPKYSITICGSYRRGLPESGDIDVLLTHSDYTSKSVDGNEKNNKYLQDVVARLQKVGLLTEIISMGNVKFMGACRLSNPTRRLDIRLIPTDQFYCGLLYFTGSDEFNKEMRIHAQQQKFMLNEYALRPIGSTGIIGEPIEVNCEEDIFEYIDYPYKRPDERNI